MDLGQAIIVCLSAYALLQLGLLPKLKRLWGDLPPNAKRKRAATVAALEKIRTYALIGAVVYGLFLIFVSAAGDEFTNSLDAIVHALDRTRAANGLLLRLSEMWSTGFFIVAFVLLTYAWYRKARKHALDKIDNAQLQEYQRLISARAEHSDRWQDLPPTPQMNEVRTALEDANRQMESVPHDQSHAAEREEIKTAINRLSQLWMMMDLDRRLEIHWDTDPVDGISRWITVARIFASRGFVSDIRGIGKFLSTASTATLALALVGVASGTATKALEHRKVELNDLRIGVEVSRSASDLETADPMSNVEETPLTQELQERVRVISRQLAGNLRRDDNWGTADPDLRREVVREAIRRRTLPAAQASSGADDSTTGQIFWDARGGGLTPDRLADAIATDISSRARKSPALRNKIDAWYTSHFEAATIDSLQEFFGDQLTEGLFGLLRSPSGALASKAAGLFTDPMKQYAHSLLKATENKLMVAMMHDDPPKTIWRTVRTQDAVTTILPNDVLQGLIDLYPSRTDQAASINAIRAQRGAAAHTSDADETAEVIDAIQSMPAVVTFAEEQNLLNLASTYESEFPVESSPYTRDRLFLAFRDFRNDLRSQVGGNSVPALTDDNDVVKRMLRSGDVEALRNYSRVGGVLIGLDPNNELTLHLRDLMWQRTGDAISISVIDPDGRSISLGTYDDELVNRALAYAADGRRAAVSILNAELIDRYQVLINPALRDTAVGGRIGRADEWIFEVLDPDTSNHDEVRDTLDRLYAASKLYDRSLSVLKSAKDLAADTAYANLKRLIRTDDVTIIAGVRSFDTDLLKVSAACFAEGADEREFDECVRRTPMAATLNSRLAKQTAPQVAFVSQIFEQPYDLDSDLNFLSISKHDDLIWPLDFTVQMTVNDKEHLTFPQFTQERKNDSIAAIVAGIRSLGESRALRDLRDFTVLQRLFREALNGRLGNEFPIEKLVLLAEDTEQNLSLCRTPRWINRQTPGGEALETSVGEALSSLFASQTFSEAVPTVLAEGFRTRMAGCAAVLSAPSADQIPASRIKSACGLGEDEDALRAACAAAKSSEAEACWIENVQAWVKTVIAVHQLRESLNAVDVPAHMPVACDAIR